MSNIEQFTVDQLRAHAVQVFREGRGSRPEAVLVEVDGRRMVMKDYGRSDPWFSRLLGPLLAYREARALRQLSGVKGVPTFLRRVNRRAILMEYIEGRTAKEIPKGGLGPEHFERLYRLVAAIHARGVAHCDLRSGGNTLFDAAGQPYFVDYVAHFVRGRRWNLLWRWAYGQLSKADRVAVARMKRRLAPELLTDQECRDLERDKNHPLARVARFIGGGIRDISRLLLTRKQRKT